MERPALPFRTPETLNDILTARYVFARSGQLPAGMSISYIEPQMFKYKYSPGPVENASEERQGILKVGSIVLIVLTMASTLGRFGIKFLRSRDNLETRWRVEDWAIIAATAAVIAFQVASYLEGTKGNAGAHIWEMTWNNWRFNYEIAPMQYMSFYLASGFTKVAIVLFLRRTLGDKLPKIRHFTTLLLSILLIYMLFAVLIFNFGCGADIRYMYRVLWAARQDVILHCVDVFKINLVLTGIHVSLDFLVLIIAMFLYWRIKSTWTRKLSLFALFGLGIISCVFSALRLSIQQVDIFAGDAATELSSVILFSMIDVTTALLVANLPTVYLELFRKGQTVMERRKLRAEQDALRARQEWYSSLYDDASATPEK